MKRDIRDLAPLVVGVALLVVAALATSCDGGKAAYDAAVESAAACEQGDTCVMVSSCLCPVAVNESEAQTLEQQFELVECCPPFQPCALADCIAVDGAECVDGRCQAIPSQE